MGKTKHFTTKFVHGLIHVGRRFPSTLVVCIFGTIIALIMVNADDADYLANIMLTLSLAAPLSVVVELLFEDKKLTLISRSIGYIVFTSLLVVYGILLPEVSEGPVQVYMRHALWVFSSILAVIFIPFLWKKEKTMVIRFWQYARQLVFALILTGIWAFALNIVSLTSLASIDFLFELGIRIDTWHQNIFILIAGIFCTTFFLSRIPQTPNKLELLKTFPKEIRLFSQFILAPATLLYFLILYAYTGKILLTGEWPSGSLAYIILGFSFVGLVTYILLHPLQKKVTWVRYATLGLFVAMIPQGFMLLWSLWIRVSEYGMTENRYFVMIYGLWLVILSIFFLVSKMKDIRLIPISICILAVLASFGPWGATSVAIRSQVDRLESILEANNLLEEGYYIGEGSSVSQEDFNEMRSIFRFLGDHQELLQIQKWFEQEIDSALIDGSSFAIFETLFNISSIQSPGNVAQFSYNDHVYNEAITVQGYDYFFQLRGLGEDEFFVDGKTFWLEINEEDLRVNIVVNQKMMGYVSLEPMIEQVLERELSYRNGENSLFETVETDQFSARVIAKELYGYDRNGVIDLQSPYLILLLDLK